jgi:hypothetical protein
MKYPKEQFEVLKECIQKLSAVMDLKGTNLSNLHYRCYQQFDSCQYHHHFYYNGEMLTLNCHLSGEQKVNYVKFIDSDKFDFKMYPDGCNDTHVETAMKLVFKQLGIK